MPDRPLGGVVWCGRGTGCGCAALLLSSTHPLGCWKDGGGVVWLVWFGMLLGFEATSLLAWLVIGCWPLMRCCACWGLVVVAGWGCEGFLVFRCLSCVCRGRAGVVVVCGFHPLGWGLRVVAAGVCLRGCGVVVWELYSEREHLADEMSFGVLFLGFWGV